MDLESQLSRETIPRIKHQYKCKCDLKNMIQKSKETFISAFFFMWTMLLFSLPETGHILLHHCWR